MIIYLKHFGNLLLKSVIDTCPQNHYTFFIDKMHGSSSSDDLVIPVM